MKNYYEILEVHKRASDEVIERAYKTLVLKHHPDVDNANIEEANKKMFDLNEAYDVLSDPTLKERYDREFEEYEFEKIMEKRASKINSENRVNNSSGNVKNKEVIKEEQGYQVGTIASLFAITGSVFKKRKSEKKLVEKFDEQTIIAIVITIAIILGAGILLWFIPFTNNFVRSVTVDNPLLSWMF